MLINRVYKVIFVLSGETLFARQIPERAGQYSGTSLHIEK